MKHANSARRGPRRESIADRGMFGFLVVDKPAGVTSRDVVNQVQRTVRPHKVGHAGTLDPLATGVLLLALGPATRLIDHLHRLSKRYEATFLLGRSSDTEDVEGQVVELADAPHITRSMLEDVLPRFLGAQDQVPPIYSALKVNGRRAYALARAGQAVALATRRIVVHTLELSGFDYPQMRLTIECSSGTYVRSLGRDLARVLNTEAVMSALRRTSIGPFTLDRAIPLGPATLDHIRQNLIDPLVGLADLTQRRLTPELVARLRNGQTIPLADGDEGEQIAALDPRGRLTAILSRREPGYWRPLLVFPATDEVT